MTAVVLDASALLALLRSEPGAKKVEGALAEARMSVVNMAEVASHYHRLERFLTGLSHMGFRSPRFSDSGFLPVQEAGMDGASIVSRSSG